MTQGYVSSVGSHRDYLASSKIGMIFAPEKFYYQSQMVALFNDHQGDSDESEQVQKVTKNVNQASKNNSKNIREELSKMMDELYNAPAAPEVRAVPKVTSLKIQPVNNNINSRFHQNIPKTSA